MEITKVKEMCSIHVLMNGTPIVNELIKHGSISLDEFSNSYSYYVELSDSTFEGNEIEKQELIEEKQEFLNFLQENSENRISEVEEDIQSLKSCSPISKEPMEFYFLGSEIFLQELENLGEMILNSEFGLIWARCCSGQAIYMDSVMVSIAEKWNL